MGGWRTLGVVAVLLAGVGPLAAQQTYPLAETVKAGDCFRLTVAMELKGEMRVSREGKSVPIKLAASAGHEYSERVLNVGPTGLADRSARVYQTARADIRVMDSRSQRTLRPERKLMVAQWHKDDYLVYSPAGAMTREEVELTEGHLDSLYLAGLLPGKAVAVGETWKLGNPVVQSLCHFEGLTEHTLAGKLEKVEGKLAHLSITGTAAGIDQGALAKLKIQAVGKFHLEAKRLVSLEWKQQDEREQGPASPASTVEVTTTVERSAIETPKELSDAALVSVPDNFDVAEALTAIDYEDGKKRFDLVHGREWHLVSQTEDHVVLRMLDRGDFVAQLTVTPWTKADKGKHLSADEFRKAMAETPGWEEEKELQGGVVPSEGGRWVYRISSLGTMDGVQVLQNFYLVAAPSGEQVVLAFTMTPKHAERLGTRDLSIAASLDFPSSKTEKKEK